jgi:hypothetical protein
MERPERVVSRLRKWLSGEGRFRAVTDNVTLYSPLALPFFYSPLAPRKPTFLSTGRSIPT